MRGHAFLTSSAETEAAQESDRIGASYFTHYLVSGLRGAADMSGEGKVTLNEAYQFAFNETLGRTVDTKGGAQHPSYDINLSGTGDVVMTDLRQTSATLVLGEELDGRFFVRNAKQELVVELYKPYGRQVELGARAGRLRGARGARGGRARGEARGRRGPAGGARARPVHPDDAGADAPAGRLRAASASRSPGRNRVELRLGVGACRRRRPAGTATMATECGPPILAVGLQYTRYLRENLALTIAVNELAVDHGRELGPEQGASPAAGLGHGAAASACAGTP